MKRKKFIFLLIFDIIGILGLFVAYGYLPKKYPDIGCLAFTLINHIIILAFEFDSSKAAKMACISLVALLLITIYSSYLIYHEIQLDSFLSIILSLIYGASFITPVIFFGTTDKTQPQKDKDIDEDEDM
jgi:hypothetical protein